MRFLSFCVAQLGLFLLGASLWASDRPGLRENTRTATAIVMGEVTESRSYYGTDGEIYTDVTVQVNASLKQSKGRAGRLRHFTVKGGTVGDTHVVFSDAPTFAQSENVLVFFAGDAVQEKYGLRRGRIPELNQPADAVLDAIEQTLADADEPIADGERRRARAVLSTLAATEPTVAPTAAAADAGCYLLLGPKWVDSQATYKFSSTIPASWQTALTNSATTWNGGGTIFAFKADAASANELVLGAVSGAGTLASTRVEYDSAMRLRRFTMTFSNAVSWTATGEAGKYDVQSVATHELGHALGLNHPGAAGCSEQTMWATGAASETKKRTLENGDKAGLGALYAAVTVPSPAPTPAPTSPSGSTSATPAALDAEQAQFLTLINAYRAANGVAALQVSVALQNASQWLSTDLATKNYFSHTDSLGRSPSTRLAAFGYPYYPSGENIAAGSSTAQGAFDQWKNACDPDARGVCTYAHRQNMLNRSYLVIGIGRAYRASSTYGWYWTTDFGGYVDPLLPGTATPAPAPTIPAPTLSSIYVFPTVPAVGQVFTVWLMGASFNTTTAQVVLTGPGCPSGCVLTPSYRQTTLLSANTSVTLKGAYTIGVRNGPTGALSATQAITVQ